MKRVANTLIVIGVGVVSLLVVYSLKINSFDPKEVSIILFLTGGLIISGMLIKTILNKRIMSREKLYSRLITIFVCMVLIIYNLVKSFI